MADPLFEKLSDHVGHDVEIVLYAGENVSVECLDCGEVIIDRDREDERDG